MRLQHFFLAFLICCLSTFTGLAATSYVVINQHKLDLHPVLYKDSFSSHSLYILKFNQAVDNLNKSLFIEKGLQIVEQFSDCIFIVYVDRATSVLDVRFVFIIGNTSCCITCFYYPKEKLFRQK
jgi:hypothetical protein